MDASENFGRNLYPFLLEIIKSDVKKSLEESKLPKPIQRAVITWKG